MQVLLAWGSPVAPRHFFCGLAANAVARMQPTVSSWRAARALTGLQQLQRPTQAGGYRTWYEVPPPRLSGQVASFLTASHTGLDPYKRLPLMNKKAPSWSTPKSTMPLVHALDRLPNGQVTARDNGITRVTASLEGIPTLPEPVKTT